jgi:3-oxoacyl-[acyl-carrier protein] reductase
MKRVAIVTGGATGIGRVLTEGLAADGYAVVAGFHGNEAGAAETVLATSAGGAVRLSRATGRDRDRHALVDAAISSFGRLTSCAATRSTFAPFLDVDPASSDRVVATNLRGTFFTRPERAGWWSRRADVLTSSGRAPGDRRHSAAR